MPKKPDSHAWRDGEEVPGDAELKRFLSALMPSGSSSSVLRLTGGVLLG